MFQTIDYTSPRGGISVVNTESFAVDEAEEEGPGDKSRRVVGYKSTLLLHRVTFSCVFFLSRFEMIPTN